ncbi:MAG: phytoene/squalene synthase family protein [Oceanicaulis sp.]
MPDRFASPDDLAACRTAIRGGSKSFFAASLLLPETVRESAYALYGFCRAADDAVDNGGDPDAACARLSARLDAVYAGRPANNPVDRAFADVVRAHDIPKALPAALIEGFAWDAGGRRYDTVSEVRAYGARVAGSVGAMMALVMGVRSPAALARACDLGVAMQLTNIVRDVGEDARNGRLYLPRAWMTEAGIDPDAWLAAPDFDHRLAGVIRCLAEEADRLYARARPGVALLPRPCRPAIYAAARIYREIGRQAERNGWDTVSIRASTSTSRKLALAFAGVMDAAAPSGDAGAACLEETRFLVAAAPTDAAGAPAPAWWRIDEHWGRMIAILHELERRERASDQPVPLSRESRG